MHRVIRRLTAVATLTVVASGVMASPAAAHASLQETTPAADEVVEVAPSEVALHFDDAVDASLGGVTVTAPDGSRVDDGAATTEDRGRTVVTEVEADQDGTYLAEWSVVSEDGHLLRGSFVFSIGRTSSVATPGDADREALRAFAGTARVFAYGGTLVLVGALLAAVALRSLTARRLPAVAAAAALAATAGAAVLLVAQTALASGRSVPAALSVLDATLQTRTGALAGLRVAVAGTAACLAALWWLYRKTLFAAALAVPVLALAVVPALAGHAWTTTPKTLAVVVDTAHLLAAGAWIGGLAATAAAGSGTLEQRLRRFSPVAAWALGATVVSGSVSSWLQTRALDAVTTTPYGRILLIKVAVVAAVAAVGFLTRRSLQRGTGAPRLVFAEVGLAVAALAATALLVNQPPGRDSVDRPLTVVADTVGDVTGTIEVQLASDRPGSSDLHVYFYNLSGLPRPVDAVEVTVARSGQPGRRVDVTPVTPEHVTAYDVSFPTAGIWDVAVTSISDGKASSTTVEVQIR